MDQDKEREAERETFVAVQLAVDKLFEFRDRFFETHPLSDADKKTDLLKAELAAVQDLIEQNANKLSKSSYYLCVGKANNVLPDFSQQAFDALSKAVKLDPSSVEAWNLLGECFWKKTDVQSARNCFTDALKWKTNKASLRGVSMTIRQLSGSVNSGFTLQERISQLEDSLERAKQAVALDATDGLSWMCLGNAYMSMFFVSTNKRLMLQHTLQAYTQAEKDPVVRSSPDMYYNRAMLYRYLCEYKSTINDLVQAARLDPLWPDPKAKLEQIASFFATVTQICKEKGRMKFKRLQQMLQSISDLDLGIYKDPVGGVRLRRVPLSELVPGQNAGVVVLGKTISFAKSDSELAFCICDVANESSAPFCMPVIVHNMTSDLMKVSDSVAIPEPTVIKVDVNIRIPTAQDSLDGQGEGSNEDPGKEFKFNLIRLETPYGLVIARRAVAADKVSVTNFSFYNLPE